MSSIIPFGELNCVLNPKPSACAGDALAEIREMIYPRLP
jgi:hypothetical protein